MIAVGATVHLASDVDEDAVQGAVITAPAGGTPPDDEMILVQWGQGTRWEYVEDLRLGRP